MTARRNILFYGKLLGFSHQEIKKRIDAILEFAELEDFADTKIKNFSTGMQARLAFATAIQINPDILFIDEILAVGDASFQKKSFQAFLEFKKKGKTIIFVSHDLNTIKKLCDRVMFISNGSIQKIGNSEEVIGEYLKNIS